MSRSYKGFIWEQFDFFLDFKSYSQLIYYLPFSHFLRPDKLEVEEIGKLWRKKYRLERYLALLFLIGILSIPVMELIIRPGIKTN